MTANITDFQQRLEAMVQEAHRRDAPNSRLTTHILLERGPKYTRIVRQQVASTGETVERSAYGFIANDTGDLLKSDGWKRPAKGIRGNLGDAEPLARCSQYSIS